MVGHDLLNPAEGGRPTERADAGRNRQRVLGAAAQLFADRDPRSVTMDDVAKQAGVGRATLYRRYPSIGAIAKALLDQHERELQERIISGPPPLGPGVAAADRLVAFYRAMTRLLQTHAALVLASEVGQDRFMTGAYGFWRLHLRHLAREAGVPDPDVIAETLLAPLAPEVFLEQRRLGASVSAIERSLIRLAQVLADPGRGG